MQERHQDLGEAHLLRTDRRVTIGEEEQARELAERVVGSVREYTLGARAAQLVRQGAAAKGSAGPGVADHRLKAIVFPGLHEMRHQSHVLAERIAERRRLERRGDNGFDEIRLLSRVAHRTNQDLVLHQVLQQALGPGEELVPGVHPQRRIEVQHQRLEIKTIQERPVGGACARLRRGGRGAAPRHDRISGLHRLH